MLKIFLIGKYFTIKHSQVAANRNSNRYRTHVFYELYTERMFFCEPELPHEPYVFHAFFLCCKSHQSGVRRSKKCFFKLQLFSSEFENKLRKEASFVMFRTFFWSNRTTPNSKCREMVEPSLDFRPN